MSDIVDPFKQGKKRDWAKLSKSRFDKKEKKPLGKPSLPSKKEDVKRVAKSFKIYSGKIPRDFDKRVNKLQVKFDDLGFDKEYVDSGKYLMFLMAISEKVGLYELYCEVYSDSNLDVSKKDLKKLSS